MPNPSAAESLDRLAQDALDEARSTKDSLAQRSVVVITTSGTLVTLVLGVAALATRSPTFTVPGPVFACTGAALLVLLIAAVLALLNNTPRQERAVDIDELRTFIDGSGAGWAGLQLTTQATMLRLDLVADLRAGNRRRGRILVAALLLEIVALALFVISALWLLAVT